MNISPREHQRQVIDAEIKSLEETIRALRHRRNALAPVSSLPTEVIIAIFSLLRLRGTPHLGKRPGCHPSLAWLNVTHVCHQWREIALDLPLFWSHVDFTNLTLTGTAEILARAKKAPLHLEARLLDSHRKVHWFSAFEMELQTRLSAICHLTISARPSRLHRIFKRLVSPAPTLETLSLSYPCEARSFIPDTLFDGVTPSLSTLKLYHCDISWKSPLLKGLKSLDIRGPSSDARPSIEVWLDALNEMPQLKRLVLHSASPSAFRFRFDVERTVTLPFLTHFNISDNTKECALALAHIVLPALTWLYITASSCSLTTGDSGTRRFLRYIAQHTHSLQDTQPLQSVFIRGDKLRVDILAWPDVDVEVGNTHPLFAVTRSARLVISFTNVGAVYRTIDAALAVLPLQGLMTLTAGHHTQLDEQFWLSHAPRWPLLQRVRLPLPAVHGFSEMLLHDADGSKYQLLPSLTRLDLIGISLSVPSTLRLCDALMMRAEQGVPLETLDLRACFGTSDVVRVLSEIVVNVWGPAEPKSRMVGGLYSASCGLFIDHVLYDNSGKED